jgi:hypothetical protein
VEQLWNRIEAWFEANVPPGHFELFPGATEDQLDAAEKILGLSLPDDLRESYRIHNGMADGSFYHNQHLLALNEIPRYWGIGTHVDPFFPDWQNQPSKLRDVELAGDEVAGASARPSVTTPPGVPPASAGQPGKGAQHGAKSEIKGVWQGRRRNGRQPIGAPFC